MTMRWPVTEGTLLSYAVRSSLITTSPTTTTSHVRSNHHFDPFPKSDPTPACLYGAFQILIDHSRNRPIYSCRPRLDDHIHHARANVCILASDMTLSRHATSPIQLLSRSISLCLTLSLTLAFPLSPQTWITRLLPLQSSPPYHPYSNRSLLPTDSQTGYSSQLCVFPSAQWGKGTE